MNPFPSPPKVVVSGDTVVVSIRIPLLRPEAGATPCSGEERPANLTLWEAAGFPGWPELPADDEVEP